MSHLDTAATTSTGQSFHAEHPGGHASPRHPHFYKPQPRPSRRPRPWIVDAEHLEAPAPTRRRRSRDVDLRRHLVDNASAEPTTTPPSPPREHQDAVPAATSPAATVPCSTMATPGHRDGHRVSTGHGDCNHDHADATGAPTSSRRRGRASAPSHDAATSSGTSPGCPTPTRAPASTSTTSIAPRVLPRAPSCSCARAARRAELRPRPRHGHRVEPCPRRRCGAQAPRPRSASMTPTSPSSPRARARSPSTLQAEPLHRAQGQQQHHLVSRYSSIPLPVSSQAKVIPFIPF